MPCTVFSISSIALNLTKIQDSIVNCSKTCFQSLFSYICPYFYCLFCIFLNKIHFPMLIDLKFLQIPGTELACKQFFRRDV